MNVQIGGIFLFLDSFRHTAGDIVHFEFFAKRLGVNDFGAILHFIEDDFRIC